MSFIKINVSVQPNTAISKKYFPSYFLWTAQKRKYFDTNSPISFDTDDVFTALLRT